MVVGLLVSSSGGCVYYNTFYNAKKAFNEGENARQKSKGKSKGNPASYRKAIEKSLKVIENYPNSKYYDDALHILMVSYYHTEQFSKSERRAREILAVYGEGEYARDAKLYMAKAKLMQKDVNDAIGLFQEIFEGDYTEQFKGEAAMTVGTYFFDNKDYTSAAPYFLALRDSLGDDEEKRLAQTYLANGYYSGFRFQDALGAYLQLLGMDPDKDDKYLALIQAADCSYRLQRIGDGQEYIRALMEEDIYFDSLAVLKLKMGEGFEIDEELAQAEAYYQDIITESEVNKVRAQAYWRLGLIYQFDYDDLIQAKVYYDSTSKLDRSSETGQDALHRSSSIGLLDAYSRAVAIDSTSTQETIDRAGYTQYQLAELYWLELNKPDSAMIAMQLVADTFPTAFDSPKALIALSEMVRETEEDTVKADSILREVLTRYPTSDYLPEALERLGLLGSSADTGYAGVYFSRAEHFVVDTLVIDSARHYYQIVVDRFPDSKLYLQSRFALVWLTETYDSPGDSSLIYAYAELADSFPATDWADMARRRTQFVPKQRQGDADLQDSAAIADGRDGQPVDGEPGDTTAVQGGDDPAYIDAQVAAFIGPDGKELELLPLEPIRIDEPFIYPSEAHTTKFEGWLYFQVLLDPFGEIVESELKTRSPHELIDLRAEEAVASMAWDPTRIPQQLQGEWMVYKFKVVLPEHLR